MSGREAIDARVRRVQGRADPRPPRRSAQAAWSTPSAAHLRATAPKPTEEQLAEFAAIRARGTQDPRVATEGTSPISSPSITASASCIATAAAASPISRRRPWRGPAASTSRWWRCRRPISTPSPSPQALEHIRTYKPDVYIPAHHDAAYNNLWRATEPLFQAVKDESPNIVTVSKGYREPTVSTPSTT